MPKAKTKKVKVTAGGEKHVVYKKTTKKGEGKVGHIMVNHPTKDKGQWDTIDLTAKGKAKTIAEGVAATKKWHKDNPDYKYKGKGYSIIDCLRDILERVNLHDPDIVDLSTYYID